MKVNGEYVLREIAGEAVLIPTGKRALEFTGIIALNPISADIWKWLQAGKNREEIAALILEEYEVTEAVALADLDEFLAKLQELDILELS